MLSPETQPHSFNGLEVIGKIFFILNLIIFSSITAIITYRFSRYPKTLKHSLAHPTESLFSATFLLSCAGIIACIGRYGVPACGEWLVVVYSVLFWAYFVITFCTGVGHYVLLFTSPRLKIQDMTPGWGKVEEALLPPQSMLTSGHRFANISSDAGRYPCIRRRSIPTIESKDTDDHVWASCTRAWYDDQHFDVQFVLSQDDPVRLTFVAVATGNVHCCWTSEFHGARHYRTFKRLAHQQYILLWW